MKHSFRTVVCLLLCLALFSLPLLTAAEASAQADVYAADDGTTCRTHQWDSGRLTRNRTCTQKGEMTYTCKRCGAKMTRSVAALGHDWGAWEGADSEERSCAVKRTCRRCGAVQTEELTGADPYAGAPADEEALVIELLSLKAPETLLPGAVVTGELKVTNASDIFVVVTGYRICDSAGQFCSNDKLEDWPQGAAILPAGGSFTLSVKIVLLSTDIDAMELVRTFSVSGETLRENEIKHDPVVSNTVTGTLDLYEVIGKPAITVELLSFTAPEEIAAGKEVTGELKVTNTGEVFVTVTGYRICDGAGQFCFNDKLEDWPQGAAILTLGDSFTLSVHVTLQDSDIDALEVLRTFSVSGETLRENEIKHDPVSSNTVTGSIAFSAPETPEEETPAAERLCSASLVLCGEDTCEVRLLHCDKHAALAARVREELAAGRPGAVLWYGELEEIYARLIDSAVTDEKRLAFEADRASFLALYRKCEDLFADLYADTPAQAELSLCGLLETKCADLCRLAGGYAPLPPALCDETPEAELIKDTDAEKLFVLPFDGAYAEAAKGCLDALRTVAAGNADESALEGAADAWLQLLLNDRDHALAEFVYDWALCYADMLPLCCDDPVLALSASLSLRLLLTRAALAD